MDSRDVVLQSVMPTVMIPRFATWNELDVPGNRLLMASNGVWLEVKRAWLYVRVKLSQSLPVAVPYGTVTAEMQFKFGKLPTSMVTKFIQEARVRSPNECAAWIVWNAQTNTWRLEMLEETSVGTGHVNVNLPPLGEDEHLIIDLHSHGEDLAFFSRTDNKDDRGETKISGVIGNLNKDRVTTAFRLCVNGLFYPLPFDAQFEQEG